MTNPLDERMLNDMEAQCGFKINWLVIVTRNEKVTEKGKLKGVFEVIQHMCAYENEPTNDDMQALHDELATDPDFGLVEVADELMYIKKARKDIHESDATFVGYSE